jgi:chaperonin GroEL
VRDAAIKGLRTANSDQKAGAEIVRHALQIPARQIVHNAGENGSLVVGELPENDSYNFGFNAACFSCSIFEGRT